MHKSNSKVRNFFGTLLGAFRISFTVIWIVGQVIPLLILYPITFGHIAWYRGFFWRIAGIVIGFKFVIDGKFLHNRPLMVPMNHTSLFDIICFGASFNSNFISKADVAKWPVFGFLASIAGTLFISRKKSTAGKESILLSKKIMKDSHPILFAPEGTTNDGIDILPFRPALFAIALEHKNKIHLQPVVIKYTHINGVPTTDEQKRLISWIVGDDVSMLRKMFNVLKYRCWTCTIKILPEIDITKFDDRKILAAHVEQIVKSEYAKL
ncbi:MAG: 1-acyl-sn-glycerol-3-phosphate acyltransferase [Rickettsiales bacterium]|jgi:1-acyl-sn-glycerol-3-phosphate acyltransferase|nr:1-acyl-sn-glycerol-3-phosphate acyltransferase [Rickettsiales bacterium]